jgi:hypothetical protein
MDNFPQMWVVLTTKCGTQKVEGIVQNRVMRFSKGVRYPHPPRGPGRRKYYLSEAARRARRENLSRSRLRSDRESLVIKLLIWQSCFHVCSPQPSQRTLARQLGISPSYICKVQASSDEAQDAAARGGRVTFDDFLEARQFTARLREREPGLLRRPLGWQAQYLVAR